MFHPFRHSTASTPKQAHRRRTGALLLALVPAAALLAAGLQQLRTTFSENFDDEALGAVPGNLVETGGTVVTPILGEVTGLITAPGGSIEVAPAIGNFADHVLRVSDSGIQWGGGYSQVSMVPAAPTGSGIVVARVDVTPHKFYGENYEFSLIDTETTPGTGKLISLGIASNGQLALSGTPQNFYLEPSHKYRLRISIDFVAAVPTCEVRITELAGGTASFFANGLPLENAGTAVQEFRVKTAAIGFGAIDLDNIKIESTQP